MLDEFTRSTSGPSANLLGSGFSARAYQGPGNEIVISYAGTEFNLNDNITGGLVDFGNGNIPLAIGRYGEQAFQAALLYEQVQARFGSAANITFTGHSLGGGLAGLMAVWFDRPATVFAPAPFEASASTMSEAFRRTKAKLDLAGFFDPKFENYLSLRDFSAREARVTSYSVADEVLHMLRIGFIWGGQENLLYKTGAAAISATQRHSIDLHAAALLSPAFENVADEMPEVLTALFDGQLYGAEPVSRRRDALVRLVRGQVGVYDPSTGAQIAAPTNLLDKFAADAGLLRGQNGTASQASMRKALIAASIEYFFLKPAAEATQLFANSGNAIHFKLNDIAPFSNETTSTLKSPRQLANAVWSLDEANGNVAESAARLATAWHVQTGTDAMTWTDADGLDDAAIGGTQSDSLDGGSGSDLLMGLGGADTLKGGTGNDTLFGGAGDDVLDGGALGDRLYGGAGADTYRFSGSFGGDWVVDSDGAGKIEVDGIQVTGAGAKKANPESGTWTTDAWAFTLVSNGAGGHDLILQRDSSFNQIRIRGWVNGQLGITLGNEVAAPQVNNTFNGDLRKKTNPEGTTYEIGADGNYVADGQQAGAQDLITGTAGADSISGLGGDDALLGRAGDDVIDGGTGSDILQGGLGADTLIGGSSNGSLYYPTRTDYTPPSPTRPVVLGQGFSWVLDSPGPDGDGVQPSYLSDNVSRDQQAGDAGNVIEGGAGNDTVYAGTGNDIVDAGADDDDVYGMGGSDALAGDGGNDRIYGDGPSQYGPEAIVYQDDALYGGIGDDTLYGDDRDNANTPADVHGRDYLDGGDVSTHRHRTCPWSYPKVPLRWTVGGAVGANA
jgi:Ca2+-binding RTX toxin-like protein